MPFLKIVLFFLTFSYSILFSYCNKDSLFLDSSMFKFSDMNEVLQKSPIYKEKCYQTEGADSFIDSMFSDPEFAILVANTLFDKQYVIKDSGEYFFVDDTKGTTGRMYQIATDFEKNELLYYLEGVQKDILTFSGRLVMRVSYCENDSGVVIYPFFYILIDNYMLRKMAGLFLKLPLLHKIIDRKIEKEILLIKKLGINLIIQLKDPRTFSKLEGRLDSDALIRLKEIVKYKY